MFGKIRTCRRDSRKRGCLGSSRGNGAKDIVLYFEVGYPAKTNAGPFSTALRAGCIIRARARALVRAVRRCFNKLMGIGYAAERTRVPETRGVGFSGRTEILNERVQDRRMHSLCIPVYVAHVRVIVARARVHTASLYNETQ